MTYVPLSSFLRFVKTMLKINNYQRSSEIWLKMSAFQALVSKPQKFLRIFRHFWGTCLFFESWSSTEIFWAPSENPEDEMNNEQQKHVNPQNFLRIYEDLQKFLRIDIFLLNVAHPQNFLGIIRFFLRIDWHVFVLKDDHPQNFLRTWANSEDWPFVFWTIVILRIFWGSSGFSEDSLFFCSKMVTLRIFWESSECSEDYVFF